MPVKHVRLNLKPLNRFADKIRAAERGPVPGNPVHEMFVQWGRVYLSFIRRRYKRMARGGWRRLKRARKRGARERASVLIDTGTLYGALTPGAQGNEFSRLRGGVRVGYGGPSKHPSGAASIADIASFHQTGAGDLPVRKIIVPPDQGTIRKMERIATSKLDQAGRQSEGR